MDKQFLDSLTDEEKTAFAEMQAEANEPAPAEPPVEPDAPEPEEEPVEAKEEPAEKAEAEPEGNKPPKGFVPHGALHSEREAKKEAERKLAEEQASRKALEERLAKLEAALPKAPEPAEEPFPDPITDPEAHTARLRKELAQRDQAMSAIQQDMRRQSTMAVLAQQAQRAKTELPDYDAAIGYAVESYKQELAYMNPGVPEDQIIAKINADVEALALNAISNGRNAAQALYDIAKMRGYRGPEPAPQAASGPSEAEKVAALAKAQENTSGFANASPSAGGGELTLARLSAMSDAEFARVQRENPDAVRRAMGA